MATAIPRNEAVFTLAEIAAACSGEVDPSCAKLAVRGVVTDSRQVSGGELYVAIKGEHHDGHRFLSAVHTQRAAAALVERASDAPQGLPVVVVADTRRALGDLARLHRTRWGKQVVAITGSAGKTTTKELTAAALSALGQRVLSTPGNLNNDIGLPMTLLGLLPTHDVAVVELGSSGRGEIARLAEIARADVAVVTTVSLAHTAGLGSLAEVADEKCALLRALGEQGVAIYSADSEVVRARKSSFGGKRSITFGESAGAQVQLVRHAQSRALTTLATYRIAERREPLDLELGLCGVAPALDAAAALAVVLALHSQSALPAAASGLRALGPLPGRLFPRQRPGGVLVIDDTYNANPASMHASLRTLAELAQVRKGRALAALGDMAELGEHSQSEHERLGQKVVELGLSAVAFCGREMAHAARAAREQAQRTAASSRIEHFAEPLASVSWLEGLLGADAEEAVLVKGSRSMAMERVVEALCAERGAGR